MAVMAPTIPVALTHKTSSTGNLAARAPVCSAVCIALPPRLDRRSAAGAWPARAPVDRAGGTRAGDSSTHRLPGPAERGGQLLVARASHLEPGGDPYCPQRLGHPHVPDPGHEPLILEYLP